MGPDAFPRFWTEGMGKYLKRLTTWFQPKVGQFFLMRAYNCFVVSVLAFLLQFCAPHERDGG